MGAYPLLGALNRRGLNPIKLAYIPSRPDPLTASTFNQLDQYAKISGNRTYCYAGLDVTSLTVARNHRFVSSHSAYPGRDGQAELAWVDWLNTKVIYPRTVTHLSTNPARRRVTSLMRPTTLPLSQTATTEI